MTFKQKLLKWFYPMFVKLGRKKAAERILINNEHKIPLRNFDSIEIRDLSGNLFSLSQLKSRKTLVVNTASDCGYTGQLGELEALYQKFRDELNIIAIPSNDFKGQEKLEGADIESFCKKNYGVSFPVLEKSVVKKSAGQSELYKWLSDPAQNGWNQRAPEWNFSKYLLNEKGVLVAYFPPAISPLDVKILALIRNM